jgi:hypothetical protein
MKNFMTSGSVTRDKEPEEDPSERGTTPFPGEDAVMMVFNGRPSSSRSCVSNLSHGTLNRYGRILGIKGCKATTIPKNTRSRAQPHPRPHMCEPPLAPVT